MRQTGVGRRAGARSRGGMRTYSQLLQAASVFVLYATSQANTVAQNQSRKTISGPDVISAMAEMEFDKFVRPLENSLTHSKTSPRAAQRPSRQLQEATRGVLDA